MNRKSFLQRFGMGVGAVILAPDIITSCILKPNNEIIHPFEGSPLLNEIFIRVVNNNLTPVEIVLLGVKDSIKENFIPDGVKISVAGSSIQQLNNAIMSNPVRINGLRMKVKRQDQFVNPLYILDETSSGRFNISTFQPLNYRSARSSVVTIIDCDGFELLLTPSIYIMTKVDAGEQVDYVFKIASKNYPWNIKVDNRASNI